jgi:phage-related protein
MTVHTYHTSGGKDLIRDYLDDLPLREAAEGYYILECLEEEGLSFLGNLSTRQLERKLWEIKYPKHNRLFYVLIDEENIYILHACKKQKGKAEKFEMDKAKRRLSEI